MTRTSRPRKSRATRTIEGGDADLNLGDRLRDLADGVRQAAEPPEHRIAAPKRVRRRKTAAPKQAVTPEQPSGSVPEASEKRTAESGGMPSVDPKSVAEVATCLWSLKTRHFKREWDDEEIEHEDSRIRIALRHLLRGKKALSEAGFELIDPIGRRYRPGSEGLMRPIQFEPTAGVAFDVVKTTIRPIVLFSRFVVQPGEVYVATPLEPVAASVSVGSTTGEAQFEQPSLGDTDPVQLDSETSPDPSSSKN